MKGPTSSRWGAAVRIVPVNSFGVPRFAAARRPATQTVARSATRLPANTAARRPDRTVPAPTPLAGLVQQCLASTRGCPTAEAVTAAGGTFLDAGSALVAEVSAAVAAASCGRAGVMGRGDREPKRLGRRQGQSGSEPRPTDKASPDRRSDPPRSRCGCVLARRRPPATETSRQPISDFEKRTIAANARWSA